MAGYSGTPLSRKLGTKPDSVIVLLGSPPGFEDRLDPLPEGVRVRRQARGRARVVLLFARSIADLRRRFPSAVRTMEERGALWLVWPKRSSGVPTDLSPSVLREIGLGAGLVDYKIAAIDETWSGLCFARRRRNTP
jgi:hypothetical protein